MLKPVPALQIAFACHRDTIRAEGQRLRPEGALRVILSRYGWPSPVRRMLPRGPAALTVLASGADEDGLARLSKDLARSLDSVGMTVLNHHGRCAEEVLLARHQAGASSHIAEIFTADTFTASVIPS